MPSLRVHEYIDKIYVGKSYRRVHRKMDEPIKYLGRGHRVLFHDNISAIVIARKEYPNDDKAVTSALAHIEYDEICTRDPEYRKFLEFMASLERVNKRRKKRRRKKMEATPNLIEFMRSLEKKKRVKRRRKRPKLRIKIIVEP